MRRILVPLMGALLVAPAAFGEFLRIEMSVPDMDCPSCTRAVSRGINRFVGVESAEVLFEERKVVVELQTGNQVSMKELRDRVRSVGFTPGPSRVRLIGKLADSPNGPDFEVSGTGERFRLDLRETDPALRSELTARGSGEVLLEGQITPPSDSGSLLRVTALPEFDAPP